ncbi:MAG TPA: TonB family protein [Thermoanaerobaculia bacterium]|nr:TonB family protein [Thermoanaerobaculia bacterium]
MFDTSIVRAHATAAPRRATLLISILIHSIAVVAAVGLTVSSTQLPPEPPRQMELYRPVEPPAPPPGPPPGRLPAQQPPVQRPVIPPEQVTAPAEIPDQTPVAVQPETLAVGTGDQSNAGPVGDSAGTPNGVPGGVPGGTGEVPGGTGTGTQTGPYAPGTLGVTSARVLKRVEPRFPAALVGAVRQATVIVLCVIGHDGRIRDPEIVRSSFPPFNESVLEALRQWEFEPGKLHGQPVDTYFELTVRFEVRR